VNAPTARQALLAMPLPSRPIVEAVLRAADAAAFGVYLVGGPVRDLLLGRPLRDVDLLIEEATGGSAAAPAAERLARRVELGGLRRVAYDRFGTVRLEAGGAEVDLASLRSETYAHPGALPRVAPGTLEEDLRRRDFTVNALALPLSEPARRRHAGVIDAGHGLADLEARVLRIFHGRSFHDDPTRALRGARLAARLGFRLARGTRDALRDALRDGSFGRVSGERFRRELEKLFDDAREGTDPAAALRLLDAWHVLGALEPGLGLSPAAVAPLRRLGRALASPPWPLRRLRPFAPGLAVWLAPHPAPMRRRTLARLAVRGELAGRVQGFARSSAEWLTELAGARGRGAADALLGAIDEESLLALYASATAPLRRRIVRFASFDRPRRAPLDGGDLLSLGLEGPEIGRVLARVRAAFLDGAIEAREDALALAAELARRPAGARRRRGPRA
jgi:tRNA nucleotidyltransferase (CCA-adding enzyme)